MTDSIKAALIINEQCMDIKGLIIHQGEGIILLENTTVNIVAGELSEELLQELQPQKEVTKPKRSHAP